MLSGPSLPMQDGTVTVEEIDNIVTQRKDGSGASQGTIRTSVDHYAAA